jgi:RNA polymerase sigma factor (sigma-70 family)
MADKPLETVLQFARKLAAVQTGRDLDDHELLRRFAADKDDGAFGILLERYGALVLGVCRRALRCAHDAEDACQATFLVLARQAANIRKTTSLGSWLHGVAARVAANLRREQSRRKRRERKKPSPAARDPAADVCWREVQSALDEELVRLPERLRAPLVLCYLDGLTRDEAAQLLNTSVGSLHGRLERGRRLLHGRLKRRGLTLSAALFASVLGEKVSRAALPPTVAVATTQAASSLVRGQKSFGEVSATVLALSREAMTGMTRTKQKLAAILTLIAGLCLATASATFAPTQETKRTPEKAARKQAAGLADAKAIQGVWLAVSVEADGKKAATEEVPDLRLEFRGEELLLGSADGKGRTRKHRFTLDAAKSPKQIDLVDRDGTSKDNASAGIYALEKDRLILCLPRVGTTRPKDFKTRMGDGMLLLVLERAGANGSKTTPRKQTSDPASAEIKAILRAWELVREEYEVIFTNAKNPEQRRKALSAKIAQVRPLGERCLKLASSFPDRPAALTALLWAAGNATATESGKWALAMLQDGRVARADPEDLFRAINLAGPYTTTLPSLSPAVLECVRKNLDHRRSARLLTWVCSSHYRQESEQVPEPFEEAAALIMKRFADSPDIYNFCETIAPMSGTPPPWARKYEKDLRTILERNRHRLVRVTAHFALAEVVKSTGQDRQEEAASLFEQYLKDFDGSDPTLGVEKQYLHVAQAELEEIRHRALGMPVPDITGEDLDGRPMKLSEFRGKVVLLSYWATWCFPCVKLIPHERALVKRLEGKPFVLVGVNSDTDAEVLKEAIKTHQITWRSFRDKRNGKPSISNEWRILGYPTLYLIDHQGIIRQRWIGAPPAEELNRVIDQVVEAAEQKQ